jgi:hypothetical protein
MGFTGVVLLGLMGCGAGSNQVVLETQPDEEALERQRAAIEEEERLAREAAVRAELAMLERERQRNLKKVEEYQKQQRLLAEREADLAALKKEAQRLSINTTMDRRGVGSAIATPVPQEPKGVDAHHLLFAERCDKTLRIIEELRVSVAATISKMRVRATRGTAEHKPSYYRLQLEKFYGFQDTLELLTVNVKSLKSQAHRMDNMTHLDKELLNRIVTLQTVKDSIPSELVVAAETRAANNPRPVINRPVEPVRPPEPRKPRKTYTLADGRVLQVLSEISSGNDLIVKTVDGKIINIRKDDIEKEEKHKK